MSAENTHLDDIFNEELEDGQVEYVQAEETNEKDEEDTWGGVSESVPQVQQTMLPNLDLLANAPTLTGTYLLNNVVINTQGLQLQLQEQEQEQYSGRVRRREEAEMIESAQKIFCNDSGKRIIKDRTPSYNYLRLKSGDEFYFTEDDGKNILLNELLEPSRRVRNIISKIPIKMRCRLEYLGKFMSDEYNEDDKDEEREEGEEDSEENSKKDSEENSKKVQQRYLGNLKDAVYNAYIKEWRLRFLFKRVLILWRIYKMDKTYKKEIDPITLSEPEKEICVYDWTNRKKFIFDAKSLATLIESKLLYHEYGFPVPQYPRNPSNNVEFTYKQLISVYNQLKTNGELRWGLTTLREYDFNKNRWQIYHKSALTINSIKSSIALLDSFEARELFTDFIFAKMDELGIVHNNYILNAYNTAIARVPTHWYLEKLKPMAILHYEAEHFGCNRDRFINTVCIKIFKKHNRFIADLQSKHII